MNTPIISIKPRYTRYIYQGNKIVELRKKIGKEFREGKQIYIYSSTPVKQISGKATINAIEISNIETIRHKHLKAACIDTLSFDEYYQNHTQGVLIWLTDVYQFENGPTLEQLRKVGFNPPQSYCYATKKVEELLNNSDLLVRKVHQKMKKLKSVI